jgi:hypothetical protein
LGDAVDEVGAPEGRRSLPIQSVIKEWNATFAAASMAGPSKTPPGSALLEEAAHTAGLGAGFAFRFGDQDRSTVLAAAGKAIGTLVPTVLELSAEPSLSPQALSTARSELQRQMNLYALASEAPGALRTSGLIPAEGFELNLRIAEAYRQGAEDLARTPAATGERTTPTEAARRLRALSPEYADGLLDGAISIAGMRYLDTASLVSERERAKMPDRANTLKVLGEGYMRYGIDVRRSVERRISFWDQFQPWDRDAVDRLAAPVIARGLIDIIDRAATRDVSRTDYASLEWGARAATGRQLWGSTLATFTAVGGAVGSLSRGGPVVEHVASGARTVQLTSQGIRRLAAPGASVILRPPAVLGEPVSVIEADFVVPISSITSRVYGVELAGRLSPALMATLQKHYGREFAQIYLAGPGRNGGGGKYYLLQLFEDGGPIPIGPNVRIINHTHPEFITLLGRKLRPTPLSASEADRDSLFWLGRSGSPQRRSQIVPEVGEPFYFTGQEPAGK